MRLINRIEQDMMKFSHAHDPYCVGMRDGMGEAADQVVEEVRRIVQELQKEAKLHDSEDPAISCGLRKAIMILTGERSH